MSNKGNGHSANDGGVNNRDTSANDRTESSTDNLDNRAWSLSSKDNSDSYEGSQAAEPLRDPETRRDSSLEDTDEIPVIREADLQAARTQRIKSHAGKPQGATSQGADSDFAEATAYASADYTQSEQQDSSQPTGATSDAWKIIGAAIAGFVLAIVVVFGFMQFSGGNGKSTEQAATAKSTTSTSKSANKIGGCRPSDFSSSDNTTGTDNATGSDSVTVYVCDGKWAYIGVNQTGQFSVKKWENGKWGDVAADSSLASGIPCFTSSYARDLGISSAVARRASCDYSPGYTTTQTQTSQPTSTTDTSTETETDTSATSTSRSTKSSTSTRTTTRTTTPTTTRTTSRTSTRTTSRTSSRTTTATTTQAPAREPTASRTADSADANSRGTS